MKQDEKRSKNVDTQINRIWHVGIQESITFLLAEGQIWQVSLSLLLLNTSTSEILPDCKLTLISNVGCSIATDLLDMSGPWDKSCEGVGLESKCLGLWVMMSQHSTPDPSDHGSCAFFSKFVFPSVSWMVRCILLPRSEGGTARRLLWVCPVPRARSRGSETMPFPSEDFQSLPCARATFVHVHVIHHLMRPWRKRPSPIHHSCLPRVPSSVPCK